MLNEKIVIDIINKTKIHAGYFYLTERIFYEKIAVYLSMQEKLTVANASVRSCQWQVLQVAGSLYGVKKYV